MAKNRARDARRVAKSIRTHQATMAAYGAASMGGRPGNLSSTIQHPNSSGTGMTSSKESYPSAVLHTRPESVRLTTSRASKIDKQRSKGLLTQGEASMEKFEAQAMGSLYTNNQKETHNSIKEGGSFRDSKRENKQYRSTPRKEKHKNDRIGKA
jgi:hypothetical protein